MSCNRPYTSADKWISSIIAGLLFIILASPYAYDLTHSLGINTINRGQKECPTLTGLIIHGLFYALLIRILLNGTSNTNSSSLNSPSLKRTCPDKFSSKDKWIIAVIGGMLFLLIGSPYLFGLTNMFTSKFGSESEKGCPSAFGLLIHGVVFTLLVRLLIY